MILSVDFEKIKELRKQIKELLKEKPELQPLQDEIDAAMKKVGGNTHNRCAVLQDMMLTKWMEIIKANEDLQGVKKGLE